MICVRFLFDPHKGTPMQRLICLCLVLLFVPISLNAAEQSRVWTDSSGTFTIDAALLNFDGETVKLKKKDGKILSLAIDKLCEEDRDFLSEKSGKSRIENPFESAEKQSSGSGSQSKTRAVDLKKSKVIDIQGNVDWNCPPDPAPVQKFPEKIKRVLFRMGDLPQGSFPKETDFFFNRNDGKKLLSVYQIDSHGRAGSKNMTKIFLADVTTGKSSSINHTMLLTPYGLSPDGTKAMFLQGSWENRFSQGNSTKLHIVKCSSEKIEPLFLMEPFAQMRQSQDFQEKTADVKWAAWATNEHILVMTSNQWLFLVPLSTGKAIWRIRTGFDQEVVLSPGGKYLLVHSGREMVLMETVSGEFLGLLDGADGSEFSQTFAFSPDGKKIAAAGLNSIAIWDATTGAAEESFYIQGTNGRSPTDWVSERFLLVGPTLIDTYTKTPVWNYQGHSQSRHFFGGYVWYTVNHFRDGGSLVGVTIPHLKISSNTPDKEDDRLFVIRPGMTVSLSLAPSISQDRDEIKKAFEKKMQENGLKLADNAQVSLFLNVSEEKENSVQYQAGRFPMFLPHGGGTEIKYRPKKYSCQYRQGNETLWETGTTTHPPQSISTDDIKNSSLQSIVDNEMNKQHYKQWFLDLNLPARIPKQTGLGTSVLGEAGIR